MIDPVAQLGDRLRIETIDAMKEILSNAKKAALTDRDLNDGIWYPSDYFDSLTEWKQHKRIEWFQRNKLYEKGWTLTSHFERKDDSPWHFIAKKTVDATTALHAAMKGPSIFECGNICQMVRYRVLERILGVEKFQRLFDSRVKGAAINLGYMNDDTLQPLRLFITFPFQDKTVDKQLMGTLGNRPLKVGQLVTLFGVALYPYKHPFGIHRAFNVICSDDTPHQQKFIGFGLDINGASEQDIYQEMLNAHNKPPSDTRLMNEEERQKFSTMRQKEGYTKFDQHTDRQVLGFFPLEIQDYNISLIWQLVQTPVEQILPALEVNYKTN